MTTLHTVSFQKTVLASLIGLCLSQSVFALQEISDAALSETTGEGIAMLPEDFRMVFQGARTHDYVATPNNNDYTDRTKDTGYIRYIPVGPLTAEATAAGAQKADMFLYGLAVSRADTDINNRYNSSATGQIKSWGSADNPWLLKVQSATIPNFAGVDQSLSYLTYETPTYDIVGFADVNKDDYHLKLGLWADVFMRSSKVAAPDNNPSGWGAGLSNRLRLQAIWNDFSINGSSINLFQTLGGATNAGGLSTSYNNTLGLAGTLRFNSGNSDSSVLHATINAASSSRTWSTTSPASSTTSAAAATTWNTPTTPTAPSGGCDNNFSDLNCQYRFQNRTVTDAQSNVTWSLDPALAAKVLRFSTRGVTGEDTSTPAIDGGVAPTFDATEGLHLYGANFNLVLGSLAQPLVVGVASDGRNLNMEITRIPNQANVYQKIYTDYANPTSTTYLGSTCNVYQCGRAGNSATHSSISIGSTNYDNVGSKNLLTAYQQADAIGVSFNALPVSYSQNGNFTKSYNEVQYQQRGARTADYVVTDRYRLTAISTNQTTVDPYASPLGNLSYSNFRHSLRWYNVAATHNYWGYATGLDANGDPIYGDDAGRNLISSNFTVNGGTTVYHDTCTVAYTCLGGAAAYGAAAVGGNPDRFTSTDATNYSWVQGANGQVGNSGTAFNYNGGGLTDTIKNNFNNQLNALGFVAGLEDCWTGSSSGVNCDGMDDPSTFNYGITGWSRLNDGLRDGDESGSGESGYISVSPNTANNGNWTYNGRAPAWFNASNNANAAAVYNSQNYAKQGGGTLTADIIPTQITAVNPSPLNNLGSAVIDGLLIQHMKLTTKGL